MEGGRKEGKKKEGEVTVTDLLLHNEDDVAGDDTRCLVCLATEGDLLAVAHALRNVHLQHLALRHNLPKPFQTTERKARPNQTEPNGKRTWTRRHQREET